MVAMSTSRNHRRLLVVVLIVIQNLNPLAITLRIIPCWLPCSHLASLTSGQYTLFRLPIQRFFWIESHPARPGKIDPPPASLQSLGSGLKSPLAGIVSPDRNCHVDATDFSPARKLPFCFACVRQTASAHPPMFQPPKSPFSLIFQHVDGISLVTHLFSVA